MTLLAAPLSLVCRTYDRWLLANLVNLFDLVGNGIASYVEELAATCVVNPKLMMKTTRVFAEVEVIPPLLVRKCFRIQWSCYVGLAFDVKLFFFTVLTAVWTINMEHCINPLVSYTSCTMLIDKRTRVESEHRERLGQWVHVTFSK